MSQHRQRQLWEEDRDHEGKIALITRFKRITILRLETSADRLSSHWLRPLAFSRRFAQNQSFRTDIFVHQASERMTPLPIKRQLLRSCVCGVPRSEDTNLEAR